VKNIKNFDGISKSKRVSVKASREPDRLGALKIDSIVKRPFKKPAVKMVLSPFFVVPAKIKTKKAAPDLFFRKFYSQKKVPVGVAALGLVIAFAFGSWSVLNTKSSIADTQPQVLGAFTQHQFSDNQNGTLANSSSKVSESDGSSAEKIGAGSTNEPNTGQTVPSGSPIAGAELQNQSGGSVGNDVLFNTPIEYLQSYFQSASQPDVINRRKNQLEQFLTDAHSPLAQASETIAEQDHWRLILAIAFAESTLGKNCADNNCSNIGVKPGAPSWRSYASYSAWVVDFNRLLDKKYKDWTLEQMCGVYVKPCNPNWLLATQEILSDLKEQGIE